jgi:hypothetical protein
MEPAVFRRALFGAIDEIAREWVLRSRDQSPTPDLRRTGEQIADFIIRGLKADPA